MQISLSRKEHKDKGEQIPSKYKKDILDLLNYNYQIIFNKYKIKKKFDFYCQLYSTELLMIISLLDDYGDKDQDQDSSCISFFLSIDMCEGDSRKYEKYLYRMLDFVGPIIEHSLDDFTCEDWSEVESNSLKIFYKISRENIALTLHANRLLADFVEDYSTSSSS
ncbi:MAG: hypothetical protein HQK49_01070 [Oligoflexia bacterium]|nr:hypothetical protein [Oligoflexia bacterium]